MPVPLPSDADVLLQPPDAAEARIIAGGVAAAIAPAGGLTSLQRVLVESLIESMTGFVVPGQHGCRASARTSSPIAMARRNRGVPRSAWSSSCCCARSC